mgnify:CR=1 FL=1
MVFQVVLFLFLTGCSDVVFVCDVFNSFENEQIQNFGLFETCLCCNDGMNELLFNFFPCGFLYVLAWHSLYSSTCFNHATNIFFLRSSVNIFLTS